MVYLQIQIYNLKYVDTVVPLKHNLVNEKLTTPSEDSSNYEKVLFSLHRKCNSLLLCMHPLTGGGALRGNVPSNLPTMLFYRKQWSNWKGRQAKAPSTTGLLLFDFTAPF